ncbi:MAG: hypothetical protein D3924_06405 [Candidatus Electrothrix sp. AR4]|nr:hypothetical protein [Candidatus Electrothrix sp. AR4]
MRLAELDSLVSRVRKTLNKKDVHGCLIDFSYGFSEFDPENPVECNELIKKADSCMYDQKMKKKKLDHQ